MKRLLVASILCLSACSQTPPPPPPTETKPAEQPPPEPPVPLKPAPKARASLSFLSDCDAPSTAKAEEIEAEPLKIGMIPTAVPRPLANQLIEKTRVWTLSSADFDFYKILAPSGLHAGKSASACIRYAMDGGAEMDFSVTYDPKKPEILTLRPVRIRESGFAGRAAVKVALSLKTYSLERTSGRQSTSLQNEEMAVEIFQGSADIHYAPDAPSAKIPLPPWDYSAASDRPRHNLSVLGITVTEIADFEWLQSQIRTLWPGWEYEATDVSKLQRAAQVYGQAHQVD